ncbi:MAG: four helix bundle protein [Bacteroidota bacterium]
MHFRDHRELEVYKMSYRASMEIFALSKSFPKEERYSLVDQIRRSSRAVSGIIAEAFRKRRYPKSFISKLNESEGEAAETQTWIDFARDSGYIDSDIAKRLDTEYDRIIGKLVVMQRQANKWSV